MNRRIIKEKSNQITNRIFQPFPTCHLPPISVATPSGSPGCSQCLLPARCQVSSPLMHSPSRHPGRRRPGNQWYSSSQMGWWSVVHSHQKTRRRKRLEQAQALQHDVGQNQTQSVLTTRGRAMLLSFILLG